MSKTSKGSKPAKVSVKAKKTQAKKVVKKKIEKPEKKIEKKSEKKIEKKKPTPKKFEVLIGPPKLTRFERARIIGARALQLSLGAPPFVPVTPEVRDPIHLATLEVKSGALPLSIRRNLPDHTSQNIPVTELM